jgi:hypothetical protein
MEIQLWISLTIVNIQGTILRECYFKNNHSEFAFGYKFSMLLLRFTLRKWYLEKTLRRLEDVFVGLCFLLRHLLVPFNYT